MMLTFAIVFVALFASGWSRPSSPSIIQHRGASSYIIGGQVAQAGQFPSQLSLEYLGSLGWSHSCGAIMIRNRYALTAAHCVDGLPTSSLRIWGAVIYRNDTASTGGQLIPISSYCKHENYSATAPGFPNNLAILTLVGTPNLSGPNLQNALLPPDDTNPFIHGGCAVSGYGRVDNDFAMSNSLQWRQINAITNQDCTDRFQDITNAEIYTEHLCIMSDPPQDGPCNGDSGSPLSCHPSEQDTSITYVAGVLSWNAAVGGNCNLQYPGVTTRISKHLDWIYRYTPQTPLKHPMMEPICRLP